jgi:hypothetical protein
MTFIKTIFTLYLAVISLAAPQSQPSEHDGTSLSNPCPCLTKANTGIIIDVDTLNNDFNP